MARFFIFFMLIVLSCSKQVKKTRVLSSGDFGSLERPLVIYEVVGNNIDYLIVQNSPLGYILKYCRISKLSPFNYDEFVNRCNIDRYIKDKVLLSFNKIEYYYDNVLISNDRSKKKSFCENLIQFSIEEKRILEKYKLSEKLKMDLLLFDFEIRDLTEKLLSKDEKYFLELSNKAHFSIHKVFSFIYNYRNWYKKNFK